MTTLFKVPLLLHSYLIFYFTGDVSDSNGGISQEEWNEIEACNTWCCIGCKTKYSDCGGFSCRDKDKLQTCIRKPGCKNSKNSNGAFSYQANAFVTIALLIIFYFLN